MLSNLAEQNAAEIYAHLTTLPHQDYMVAHLTSRAILEAASVVDNSAWKHIQLQSGFSWGNSDCYAVLNFQHLLLCAVSAESQPVTDMLRVVHVPYIDSLFNGGGTNHAMVPFSNAQYDEFTHHLGTWQRHKEAIGELVVEFKLLLEYAHGLRDLKKHYAVVRYYLNRTTLTPHQLVVPDACEAVCVVAELANGEGILIEYLHGKMRTMRQRVKHAMVARETKAK